MSIKDEGSTKTEDKTSLASSSYFSTKTAAQICGMTVESAFGKRISSRLQAGSSFCASDLRGGNARYNILSCLTDAIKIYLSSNRRVE